MGFTESLKSIGDSVSKFFDDALIKISEWTGLNPENLSTKLLTLLIFIGLFYLGTRIANKTAKWLFIIVSIVLAVSVMVSLG